MDYCIDFPFYFLEDSKVKYISKAYFTEFLVKLLNTNKKFIFDFVDFLLALQLCLLMY